MENKELIIEFLKYCVDFFDKNKPNGSNGCGFCSLLGGFGVQNDISIKEYSALSFFIETKIRQHATVTVGCYYFENNQEREEVAKKLLKELEAENGE